jgi:hypothetical protein
VKGRDRFSPQISLQTRTLRYNQMKWATITALHEHWLDSRLDATVVNDHQIKVTTKNVDGFALSAASALTGGRSSGKPTSAGEGTGGTQRAPSVEISIDADAENLSVSPAALKLGGEFFRATGKWIFVPNAPQATGNTLRKRHALQGPIDDAFMAPFLVVMPSGKCADPRVQQWVDFESRHLEDRWRAVFRGELRIKRDTEVSDDDISRYHLLLWGDPQANKLIARIADRLPVQWDNRSLTLGTKSVDASTHLPLLIYPNPLNPGRYIVLNSGPTFREADDRTNSLQNPKLPDWAIVDVTTKPDDKSPGKVVDAGFFDENWKLKP